MVGLMGLGFFGIGLQQLWTWITNTSPLEISAQDYTKQRPSAKWIKLNGCYLDLTEAAYFHKQGSNRVTELFIPVRPVQDKEAKQIFILIGTKNAEMLALAQKLADVRTEQEAIQILQQNEKKIFQETDIRGLIRHGVDLDSKDRARLAGLDKALSADFVILDEGKKPDPMAGLIALGLGVGCMVAMTKAARGQ